MTQYRQGHILLNPVPKIPVSAVLQSHPERGVVVATGETGREHVFKSTFEGLPVAIYMDGGKLYIEVSGAGALLEHPEHGDFLVEPGTYEVVDQREADPERIERARASYD